jgi:GntR family transcriptional regulator
LVTRKKEYLRVKQDIENRIIRGKLTVGMHLEPEEKLAELYKVSRSTVRQALGELVDEKVIERRPRRGTVVVDSSRVNQFPKEKTTKTDRMISLREQITSLGLTPSVEILDASLIRADEVEGPVKQFVLIAFGIDDFFGAATRLYRIDRLFLGDQRPLARQTVYLSPNQFPPEILQEDLHLSLFNLYERYKRRKSWANEGIRARLPETKEIELLGELPADQPFVYERRRVTYQEDGSVLEVLVAVDRSDLFGAYRYRIEDV